MDVTILIILISSIGSAIGVMLSHVKKFKSACMECETREQKRLNSMREPEQNTSEIPRYKFVIFIQV